MSEEETPNDFAELVLDLHATEGVERTVEIVVERARSALLCDEAGVLLVERAGISTAAATSPEVRRSDELQNELGEGPCLSSIETGELYVIEDMDHEERWPAWARSTSALGFHSLVSVPLSDKDRRLGSLNLFARRPGAFSQEDVAVANIFARHAGLAVANERHTDNLLGAIDSRKLIGQAQGILMERYKIDSDRAFHVLSRYSQTHNVKLRDVAEQIVRSRTLPGLD